MLEIQPLGLMMTAALQTPPYIAATQHAGGQCRHFACFNWLANQESSHVRMGHCEASRVCKSMPERDDLKGRVIANWSSHRGCKPSCTAICIATCGAGTLCELQEAQIASGQSALSWPFLVVSDVQK